MHQKLSALVGSPAHAGDLGGDGVRRGEAGHPVCGDEVRFAARFDGDRFGELRWRACGCPATMAVVALAASVLPGTRVAAAATALRSAIQAHGGLEAHERHAEGLVLRALAALGPE